MSRDAISKAAPPNGPQPKHLHLMGLERELQSLPVQLEATFTERLVKYGSRSGLWEFAGHLLPVGGRVHQDHEAGITASTYQTVHLPLVCHELTPVLR